MDLLEIPYERQEDNSKCGAASLCMVYRSLGLPAVQADIWEQIRTAYEEGIRRGARTGSLIRHLQHNGLAALGLRAAHPWELLQRCHSTDRRVIVVHRRGFGSVRGHASVLRGLDESGVVLHDPYGRPDRHLSRDDFLALWRPSLNVPLARGNVLVAIARRNGTDNVEEMPCPRCREPIILAPAEVLGDWKAEAERDWEELLCPHCEEWVKELAPPSAG